jgi:hypothetical protein
VFYLGGAIQRRLMLDRLRACLPREINFGGTVAAFFVPGLGFYLREPVLWGKVALLGCGLSFGCFLAAFGYPAGNFAMGLLIAIHATGFIYYCSPLLRDEEFRGRVGFTLLALVAIGLLFYLPLRNAILHHWLMPLRLDGRVYVVQRQFPAAAIRRGDWIAYKLAGSSGYWENGGGHGGIYIRPGVGFAPVLAVAGDRVTFSTNVFTVNGVAHPLRPHMPESGEVTLREKQWFIWPGVGISGYGNTPESTISTAMMQLALVSESDFVGKPFKRWLWRKQITP